jgi:hypothetical protein
MKKPQSTNTIQIKERKIFLNNMNSWFSNFIIEDLRTETIQDPKVVKNEFMGTLNKSKTKLPYLFQPKEIKIDYNYHYEHEIFTNDVFIYNLQDSDYNEIEYIIKGLKTLKHQTEKVLIIVTSIMTWARTPPKIFKEKTQEEIDADVEAGIQEESEEEEVPIEDEKNPDDSNIEEQEMDNEKESPVLSLFYLILNSKNYFLFSYFLIF